MSKVDEANGEMEILPETAIVAKPLDAADSAMRAKATTYERRKTIAHGMMDTALISANANQLKFIIQAYPSDSILLTVLVTLIVLSLTIQVCVGVALIIRQKKRAKGYIQRNESGCNLNVDDFIIMGLFLVIVINIFVAAFSTDSSAR